MINAGKYNKRIRIYSARISKDAQGFQSMEKTLVLEPYAFVRTTRGMTLIRNDTDFERAYTNFTIRYPVTEIDRDMIVEFKGRSYTIEYLNNVDEEDVELEMQCKEVSH